MLLRQPTHEAARNIAAAEQSRRALAARARTDPAVFCQYVLRDEMSGARIQNAPMHMQWHQLIDAHDRLLLLAHVDGGKTAQLSIGRVLWEIGRNPNLRVAVVTKTAQLAQKIIRAQAQYIAKSEPLHAVFPDLKRNPDPKLPWNVHQLTVDRDIYAKDPTIQATGIFGNIHGARIDLLVLDDVLDSENTRTKTPRDHLWAWVRATLMGRLSGGAARVMILSNAWHPDDLVHRLSREPGFKMFSFPVVDKDGAVTWPEHWPLERIEKARQDMGPLEFSRALLCQARSDEDARFKREWIDDCCARGVGKLCLRTAEELYDELMEAHPDWADKQLEADGARMLGDRTAVGPLDRIAFHTGVDLAFSKRDGADLTCIFTIAVFPNGDRRLLWIEAGRWDAPETMKRIEAAHTNYGSIVMVENVGAQRAVLDILSSRSAIPVVPYATGSAHAVLEFQVESLAVEMMNKKWIIPSGVDGKNRHREVDAWLQDLFNYDPSAHLSDRTAAACFAVACAKAHDPNKAGSVGVRVISAKG